MTEQSFNNISNIPTEDRQKDSLNNRSNTQTAIDKMSAFFEHLRSSNKKIKKDEFYGYILWASRMRLEKFQEVYDPSTDFYKEVMNHAEKTTAKSQGAIISYRVHVPEISGVLPFPDVSKYIESEKLRDQAYAISEDASAADQRKFDELSKKSEKLFKEFLPEYYKFDFFPRMYSYTESSNEASMGQFCKIKIASSLPTKGIGIVLKVYDQAADNMGGAS